MASYNVQLICDCGTEMKEIPRYSVSWKFDYVCPNCKRKTILYDKYPKTALRCKPSYPVPGHPDSVQNPIIDTFEEEIQD